MDDTGAPTTCPGASLEHVVAACQALTPARVSIVGAVRAAGCGHLRRVSRLLESWAGWLQYSYTCIFHPHVSYRILLVTNRGLRSAVGRFQRLLACRNGTVSTLRNRRIGVVSVTIPIVGESACDWELANWGWQA